MDLEQIMNTERKIRLKGIIAFADVNTAVNRWLITSSMRTAIANKVLNIAGLVQMKMKITIRSITHQSEMGCS